MGKDVGEVVEDILIEAFNRAEEYRIGFGAKPRKDMVTERKRYTPGAPAKWHGPRSYKVTLWLRPWEYVKLLDEKRADRHQGSLTGWMHERLTDPRIAGYIPTRENLKARRLEAAEKGEAKGVQSVKAAPGLRRMPRRKVVGLLPPGNGIREAAARRRRLFG